MEAQTPIEAGSGFRLDAYQKSRSRCPNHRPDIVTAPLARRSLERTLARVRVRVRVGESLGAALHVTTIAPRPAVS